MNACSCFHCLFKRTHRGEGQYPSDPDGPVFCCSDQEWHDAEDCCAFWEPEPFLCTYAGGRTIDCRMCYIHIEGYYPSVEEALRLVCPNLKELRSLGSHRTPET